MNGRDQTEAMRQLAEPWKPDQIGGIKIGDAVRLPSIDCVFKVIAINDPVVTLRAPSGREVRAGWRSVTRLPKRSK